MITLEFHSTELSKSNSKLRVYYNTRNELYIEIEIEDGDMPNSYVCLGKQEAIKLSKEIRKQVSFLEDENSFEQLSNPF